MNPPINQDEALALFNQAKELANTHQYEPGMALLSIVADYFKQNELHELFIRAQIYYSLCLTNTLQTEQAEQFLLENIPYALKNLPENSPYLAGLYLNLSCHYVNTKPDDMAHCADKVLAIYRTPPNNPLHKDVAIALCNKGSVALYHMKYHEALAYYKEALTIAVLDGEKEREIAILYQIGVAYFHLGDRQAIDYCQKTLSLSKEKKLPIKTLSSIYHILSISLNKSGDYHNAILYVHKGLYIVKQTLQQDDHPEYAKYYNTLGNSFLGLNRYKTAITWFKKAIKLSATNHNVRAIAIGNIGKVLHDKKHYKKAIVYVKKSIAMFRCYKTSGYKNNVAANLEIIGSCLFFLKKYSSAIKIHCRVARYWFKVNSNHANYAQSLANRANSYEKLGNTRLALKLYSKAIDVLCFSKKATPIYHIPSFANCHERLKLFEIMNIKAATLYALYHQNNNTQDLVAALAHYQAADQLIDQMRQSYKTEGSKLLLAEKGKTKVYDAGLAALFDYQLLVNNTPNNMLTLSHFNQTLGYQFPDRPIDLAFHFSEKSKAVLLFTGMKDAEARLNAQLPPDLVQQEYDLRVELTYLERSINEEGYKKTEEQDTTALTEWQSQHFAYKQQYDALIERLEKDFPDYYRLKYDIGATTIAQTQALLPPHTALISYVLSQQNLYIITLTPQKSYWQETALPADFEGLVADFLGEFGTFSKDDYIIYGYDLYSHLLLPIVEAGLLTDMDRLILIPDGVLSRLPFEALPTTPFPHKRYENIPYLLQQYSVSYHYSATLWVNQRLAKQRKPHTTTTNAFVGFAPVYSDTAHNKSEQETDFQLPDDFYEKIGIAKPHEQHRIAYSNIPEALRSQIDGRNFVELPQSAEEVRSIANLFKQKGEPARILLHQAASLSQFKTLAGNYRYLLIAAHVDYNGEKPDQTGIIFSPNTADGDAIFYMGDAYNLRLQADLVVLSCCETGLGKSHNGEGIMALNRGFLYAGASNVIYTLFKVYDRESSELTTELFRALLSDEEPIIALRKAKLHLIKRGLMPNKWAGYVLVGE